MISEKNSYLNEYEEMKKSIEKPNILLCGATGVGKSSIINKIFGKELATTGDVQPVTRGISKYESEDTDVVLYDSEGYEIGNENISKFKEEVIGIIENRERESSDIKKHIHLIWYCISAANKRITDLDIEVIKNLLDKKCKVAVLLTKIDCVDEDELNQLISVLNENFKELKYFTLSIDEDVPEEYLKWNELQEWSLKNLDMSLKAGFIRSIKCSYEEKQKHVIDEILPKYSLLASGIAITPLPLSDSIALTGLQGKMCLEILVIWEMDKYEGVLQSIIGSTIVSQGAKFLAKTIASNLIKFIPGFGSIIGGAVNAIIASSFNAAMGYAISTICYMFSQDKLNGKDTNILDLFTPEIISNLTGEYMKSKKNFEF